MFEQKKFIPSFARRIGKKLRDYQKELIEGLLPSLSISSAHEIDDFAKQNKSMSLEIGFGNGEFLLNYAHNNPNNICIGCEPYLNGIAILLTKLVKTNVTNIKIFADDVRFILDNDKHEILDNIFIICPDPWPKKRHNKRRIININFLNILYQKLKNNGILHIVTDHYDYAGWILDMLQNSAFKSIKNSLSEYLLTEENWVYTKYQRRGIAQESNIYYFKISK